AGGVGGGIELCGQGVVRGGVGARCELGGGLIEPGGQVREERAETGAAGGCGVLVAVGAGGGAGVVCGAPGGAARGEGLQGDAEVEEVGCLVEGHTGDDEPAAAGGVGGTVCGQAGEGFAHRCAGEPEARGLLDLGQHGAGLEGALDDLLAERRVGTVAGTHTVSVYSRREVRADRRRVLSVEALYVYTARVVLSVRSEEDTSEL